MNASFYASSKGRLLFSIRGRIPRTDFWVGFVAIVGIAIASEAALSASSLRQ